MSIKRIKSGGVYEDTIGYCRAVVAGGWVNVSGTTAQGETIPADPVGQCQSSLDAIEKALKECGATMADVVRVRYIMPDAKQFPELYPLLAKTFGDNPPAATFIECDLIDPKYLIEIEAIAYIGE